MNPTSESPVVTVHVTRLILFLAAALLATGCSVSLISAPKPLRQPTPPVDLTVTVPTFEPVAPSPTAPVIVQKIEADVQVAQAAAPVVHDAGSLAGDIKRFIAAIKIRKGVGGTTVLRNAGGVGGGGPDALPRVPVADVLRPVGARTPAPLATPGSARVWPTVGLIIGSAVLVLLAGARFIARRRKYLR